MRLIALILIFFVIGIAYALDYNISVPEEIKIGEWFSVEVSIESEKDLNLTSYSYVYKGFHCVGQGWITNKKQVFLPANETIYFELEDLVKHGTEPGYYNLRVKLKFDNKTLNETFTIKVEQEKTIEATYLYIGLVVVSLAGLYLITRKG